MRREGNEGHSKIQLGVFFLRLPISRRFLSTSFLKAAAKLKFRLPLLLKSRTDHGGNGVFFCVQLAADSNPRKRSHTPVRRALKAAHV